MTRAGYILAVIFWVQSLPGFSQQPFTAGNIVACRVGDGTATLTNGIISKVFLEEYTPSGTLVQTIEMPATGSQKITVPGGNQFGYITLSSDGRYLVIPGFDKEAGPVTLPFGRSVALMDHNGEISSITVLPVNPANNQPVAAASDNGINLWLAGSGADVEYTTMGAVTSTEIFASPQSTRSIHIADGQLYVGQATGSVQKVGAGLPVNGGQTATDLPGIGNNVPRQFAFADLNPAIPGADVLYVASQLNDGLGGIHKYSLVNGSWVLNGNISATPPATTDIDRYSGITIKVSGNEVTIFATRAGSNSNTLTGIHGGQLVRLVDNSGYNGVLTGTPTVIADISSRFAVNTAAFRGVALVPQPAPFTAGNIVAYRVGDGSAALTNGTFSKVFLEEYTPAGNLIQAIQMPSAGSQKITVPGGNQFGYMTLSSNGKYLAVPGFNKDPGPVTLPFGRSIGIVDHSGAINGITVLPVNPTNNQPVAAASDDGINLWLAGSGADVEYTTSGAATSTEVFASPQSTRSIYIADGQLYIAQANGGVQKVGTGLPVTGGQTASNLPGIGNINPLGQFAFADLNPAIPGADVLYVVSQLSDGLGGIHKYSLVNGNWALNGNITTTPPASTDIDRYAGLTIKVTGNTVTIFATRAGSNSNTLTGIHGGQLVSLVDNSGYNGALTGTPVVIADITSRFAVNTAAFRGIALVPQGCQPVGNLQALNVTSSQATISWSPTNGETNFEYAVTITPVPPVTGTSTTDASITVTGLSNGITYYAYVRTNCALSPSEWSVVSFITSCKAPSTPFLNVEVSATGMAAIRWNQVFGAAGYEYAVSTNSTPPASGMLLSDTSVIINGLSAVTTYYVHVRSDCGSGAFSEWVTKPITTACFMPSLTTSISHKNGIITWSHITNAVKYEYALTHSISKPLSGTYTTDTVYSSSERQEGSVNYFHIRSICANGSFSDWTTVSFSIRGMQVYPNPVSSTLTIHLLDINNPGGNIIIADATGRIVKRMQFSGSSTTIDAQAWSPGIYIIRYEGGQNNFTVKILKQ